MRIVELADVCRRVGGPYGVRVVEVAGWQTRGVEFPVRPDGALRHWTATSGGQTAALRAVTFGRTTPTRLPGPLCHIYQERAGDGNDRLHVVASGVANHAGAGSWNGISGNSKLLGLEIEWAGPSEAFPPRRKLISEIAMAALAECTAGANPNDFAEHREYAPSRKIDTNLSGDEMRRRIAVLRNPIVSRGGDDMPLTEPEMQHIADLVWGKQLPHLIVKDANGAPYPATSKLRPARELLAYANRNAGIASSLVTSGNALGTANPDATPDRLDDIATRLERIEALLTAKDST